MKDQPKIKEFFVIFFIFLAVFLAGFLSARAESIDFVIVGERFTVICDENDPDSAIFLFATNYPGENLETRCGNYESMYDPNSGFSWGTFTDDGDVQFLILEPGEYFVQIFNAQGTEIVESFVFNAFLSDPNQNQNGDFSFLASTTEPGDLVASVISGVQTTGQSIWPLLVFVGILLAFVIGGELLVFKTRAISGELKSTDTVQTSKIKKLPRTGDYKAFAEGKKANKRDGIDI